MPRLLTSAVFALLIVVATTFGAMAERRVALVIGNSAYKNPSLTLTNPKNDASDVADELTALGFEVVRSIDAKKSDVDEALARFARLASDSDSALFYYAGHALQYQGLNYLMPVDAELEDEFSLRFTMVSTDRIRDALNQANGVKIMILDACRNNPLADKIARRSGMTRSAMPTRGLARIDKTQGMVIAYATAAEDVAADGTAGRNSPFTAALLKRMKEPGHEITKMFQFVANDVRTQTGGRQVPELSISLADDYYLNQTDRLIWEKIRDAGDIVAIRDFIDRFPYSVHNWAAKNRLATLERAAAERDMQQRLQYEAKQRREAEEQRRKIEEQLQALQEQQRKQLADAQERETQRQRDEERKAAQKLADEEQAKQQLARIETDKQKAAEDEAQAAQKRADAQKREREEIAARQDRDQQAEKQRVAREAEEARKKEAAAAAERLAKLEAERVQAKREADEREAAAKREVARQQEVERTCVKERAKLGGIETDLKKLQAFAKDTPCEATRTTANDRIAALNAQAETCKYEEELFAIHKNNGLEAREKLTEFEKQVTCERLRPAVTAFLAKQLIRATQVALRDIGCFNGADNGEFTNDTRAAVKRFLAQTDRDENNVTITADLLTEIKTHAAGTCPLSCPAGKIAEGNICVASRPETPPPVRVERPRREKVAHEPPARKRVVERPAPAAPVARAEPPRPSGGTQRALGVGF